MNLKKISAVAKVVCPVILVFVLIMLFVLNVQMSKVTDIRENGAAHVEIGNDIMHSNDKLIKLMRLYVVTHNPATLRDYESELDTLDRLLEAELKYEMAPDEDAVEAVIMQELDRLAEIEGQALSAIQNGDPELAVSLILGDEYINLDIDLAKQMKSLIAKIKARTDNDAAAATSQGKIGLIAVSALFVVSLVTAFMLIIAFGNKMIWYEDILDHMPSPISVTDMHRNTTFINKPVEDFLGVKRKDAIGRQCSEVWKAGICNTPNCGIECVNRGQTSTLFSQMGMDFKVDTNYLAKNGRKVGHIEVVSDLTALMKTQKEEAALIGNIEDVSHTFVAATKQISDGSQTLADGAIRQAASMEELSSAISEVAHQTSTNADTANKAADLATSIKSEAEQGSRHMDDMMSAVKDINQASQQISKVIKVIDDIAFQTNILALNAAVEAARAGQHGKGFAVVAEEVRNLASKSAEAAKETGNLIANSTEKAELGSRIAEETSASLAKIVSGINESTQLIVEIASSSGDQSKGISQINKGISQMAEIVQLTSSTAEESAASSGEMSSQARHLEDLLYQFKRRDGGAALPPGKEPPAGGDYRY